MHMMDRVCFELAELQFTWDTGKYKSNIRKYQVTFEEAATTWMDSFAIEYFDEEHSLDEPRWIPMGASLRGAIIVSWSTECIAKGKPIIRIIGARRATGGEKAVYAKENKKN